MKPVECQFEADVLAAVVQSRWPDHVDTELREHAAGCPICSDVAAIAGQFEMAGEAERAVATVPDAGRVWWRAEMRARREAVQAAGRPITAAQVIAFACAVGLLGACFGATSMWFQLAFGRVVSGVSSFDFGGLLASASGMVAEHALLCLGLAAIVFLLPTAVYVALGRD
jgi:hypothetical protein